MTIDHNDYFERQLLLIAKHQIIVKILIVNRQS